MVPVNQLQFCMQSSKDVSACQGSLCCCKNPRPDVQREGGGGKTNISLLESSEGAVLRLQNINSDRQDTKMQSEEEKNDDGL